MSNSRFSLAMFILTLSCLGVMCVGVWRVLDRPLRGFVIEGDLTAMEQQKIQQILSAKPLAGVLSTNLQAVAQRLQLLPWAREISVHRSWPDKLIVTMHRATPVARWGDDQYLSAYGDLLSLPDEHAGLPRFKVAVSNPAQAMEVYRLLDQIAAREALTIDQLHQNGQGEWVIDLVHGPRVLLGAEQLNQRMHRFLLVYRRVLLDSARDAEYVDARYASGVAVLYLNGAPPYSQDELLVAQNSQSTIAEGNR